jgi:hypothetical protein
MTTPRPREFFRRHVLRLLFAAGTLAWALPASGALTITRWTVDGGGIRYFQMGSITAAGTIGQPDAGLLVGRDMTVAGGFWIPGGALPTGVDDGDAPGARPILLTARIYAASPNPVIGETALRFDLPEAREVVIQVFDVTGALRRTLSNATLPAGRHAVRWDASDARGEPVASGLYVVRVRLGDLERNQKLLVMR